MKARSLLQVCVATSPEAEDAVVELLGSLFAQPASVYVNEETKATVVTSYCHQRSLWNARRKAALTAGLARIRACGLDIGPGKITTRNVRREDWAESWKRHFKPLEIGPALLIKPSWSRRRARRGQAVVVLDPGLSFGTGQHATTSFCLHQLTDARREGEGQSFLDIGTGSGILSISAAKLGYAPVVAFDFDPEAVRVANANAAQNGVGAQVRVQRRDLTRLPLRSARRHDVVCANLIYNLLLAESARILARVRTDGMLVLAGILATQFAQVRQHYERAGMKLVASRAEKEWRSGTFRPRG